MGLAGTATDERLVIPFRSATFARAPREQADDDASTQFALEPLEPRVLLSVSVNAAGWTQVGRSADTRVIYVSSSAGKDTNTGLSANTPVKTLAHAKTLMRSGKPDWMLLKRGDVWFESLGNWALSGRSVQEPILISSYGSGDRPLLRTGSTSGISSSSKYDVSHVAIIGLNFHAHTRDPSAQFTGTNGKAGIQWMASGSDLLLENVSFQSYTTNLIIQSKRGFKDFKLRRSAVLDAYDTSTHSQGLFAQNIHGILLEENLFDHNGWNAKINGAQATMFNHNIYIQSESSGLVARGNIIARASSHGLQARTGGIVSGNLFVENPLALSFGVIRGGAVKKGLVPANGVSGQVVNNVFLDGNDISNAMPRGTGIELGNLNGVLIANNLFAHDDTDSTTSRAIQMESDLGAGIRNVLIENNTIYNWRGGVRVMGAANRFTNVVFSSNVIQNLDAQHALMRFDNAIAANRFSLADNTYYTERPADRSFFVAGKEVPLGEWVRITGERNSQLLYLKLPDPKRDVATYGATLGREAGNDAFLKAARTTNEAYNPNFMAQAVNRYVRAGYGMDGGAEAPAASPAPDTGGNTTPPDTSGSGEKPGNATPSADLLTPYHSARNAQRLGTLMGPLAADGAIAGAGDVFYRFNTKRKTLVALRLLGAGSDAVASLLRPGGALLGQSGADDQGNQVLQLPVNRGRSLLRVTTAGAANFKLEFEALPMVNPSKAQRITTLKLTGQQTFEDQVSSAQSRVYRILVGADTRLILRMSDLSGNANLELLRPRQGLIAESRNAGTGVEFLRQPVSKGVYLVRVTTTAGTPVRFKLSMTA